MKPGPSREATTRHANLRWPAMIASRWVATTCVVVLSACGGGGQSSNNDGTNASASNLSQAPSVATLLTMSPEAAGAHCAAGGTRILTGQDANQNGKLDADEVSNTQYVCQGTNGSDGKASLSVSRPEPAGAQCAHGGYKITSGLDANGDGQLQDSEVSATAYACNGATGPAGVAGPVGPAGPQTLVSVTALAVGSGCASGGLKFEAGADLNTNSVLDPSEVVTTSEVCTPPASTNMNWVRVTGNTQQASPNTGYLADNAAGVTINLPPSRALTVGDRVAITGVNPAGWTVTQNAGQSIYGADLGVWSRTPWTAHDASRLWRAVASSADGNKLVAVVSGGPIYTSADGGANWTPREANRSWTGVASSADGSKLVAVASGDQVYTSTDSGLTWVPRASSRSWGAVASSADGNKLVALDGSEQIYTSTDGGANWTPKGPAPSLGSVASSADGSKLIAASNGYLYTSADSGANWTPRLASRNLRGVASSADGNKLVAVVSGGQIYTSSNGGGTWAARDSTADWTSVTSSADGFKLAASISNGVIRISRDAGATWQNHLLESYVSALASSADGLKLVAVCNNGPVYTSSFNTSTTVGPTGTLSGGQYASVTLQYLGGGVFLPVSSEGAFIAQ